MPEKHIRDKQIEGKLREELEKLSIKIAATNTESEREQIKRQFERKERELIQHLNIAYD